MTPPLLSSGPMSCAGWLSLYWDKERLSDTTVGRHFKELDLLALNTELTALIYNFLHILR